MRLLFPTIAFLSLTSAAFPCALPSPETLPQSLPATVILNGGVAVPVPGTDLTLTLVTVEDSRCPAGLACVWQGSASVRITVALPGQAPQDIRLCDFCQDITATIAIAGLRISYVGLTPSTDDLAALGRPVMVSDYRLAVSLRAVLP